MKEPGSYAKTYEEGDFSCKNTVKLPRLQKICKVLCVAEEEIFDEYMCFLTSDYRTRLLELQEKLGQSNGGMDKLFGMSKGQYKKWVTGKTVPGREAVRKILKELEKKDNYGGEVLPIEYVELEKIEEAEGKGIEGSVPKYSGVG